MHAFVEFETSTLLASREKSKIMQSRKRVFTVPIRKCVFGKKTSTGKTKTERPAQSFPVHPYKVVLALRKHKIAQLRYLLESALIEKRQRTGRHLYTRMRNLGTFTSLEKSEQKPLNKVV